MKKALALLIAIGSLALHGCGEPAQSEPFKVWPTGCTKERPCPKPKPAEVSPSFTVQDATVAENAGTVTISIHKAGGNGKSATISYATANGTATAGSDYTATSGSLTFTSTQTDKTVSVPITDDSSVEQTESFGVNISAVTNARIIRTAATVTITDNDVAPPPPPQMQTCWDGSVILATATCPAQPPPPPTTKMCPDGSMIPIAQNCPTPPPPTTAGWVPTVDLNGITGIPTGDFSVSQGKNVSNLPPSNCPNGPGSANCDNQGAFRFICGPGQILADDPIVFPDQPGKSHLHQFYGNLDTNAHSTYSSQRAHGQSTCSGPQYALNRSGYWMPALLDGKGNVVRPNYAVVYYKRFPSTDPQCSPPHSAGCVTIPNGLRMIAGRDMLDLSKGYPGTFGFTCTKPTGQMAQDATGKKTFANMRDVLAICPTDGTWQLTFVLGFPECWDGQNIDSPDHRSHVGYAAFRTGGQYCPVSAKTGKQMFFMPTFTLTVAYSVMSGDDTSLWRLSSDAMAPSEAAGSTLHGDYLESWDPSTKQEWTANCIEKLLSCQGGNLGDGFALPGAQQPPWGWNPAPNRLIPLSSVPQTQ